MTSVLEQNITDALAKDFSKFGQKFQLATLSLFIQDRVFANKIKSIIKPEYFDNVYCQRLCEITLNFINTFHTQPDFDTLKTIIETDETLTSTKLYLLTLENIKNVELSKKDFVGQEVEKFCFTRFALTKLEEEKNNILLGKFEIARETGMSKYKVVNHQVKEYTLKQDFTTILDNKNYKPVATNLPSVNLVTQGGPGGGNLCVIVAQSNFGKSNALVALARQVALDGKKALYISLETDGIQLIQRALAGLTNLTQETLKEHPGLITQKVKDVKGDIKFIELKATQAFMDKIAMQIDQVKGQGFFPDLIMIDGLNQVKPSQGMRFSNSNDKFEYIAEEMRDLAKELDLPIYTCFQSNRGGFNTEMADEQNIGKAIEVYQVCDFMLMFTQSIPQQETSECHVQVLKNRLGPKGLTLKLQYDPNKCVFTEVETVQRSLLYDRKLRTEITKGLDTMQDRIDKAKGKR